MPEAAAGSPLIVALDLSSEERALHLVEALKNYVAYFKVGLQLFTSLGPRIVVKIIEAEGRVFLDLKLHDIPNTVANAALSAAQLGVHMITLHALGGGRMMSGARELLEKHFPEASRPKLLGVTILTSIDQTQLWDVGFDRLLDDEVLRLAHSIDDAGLDGIVASPRELGILKKGQLKRELLLVTPGIRPPEAPPDDQARTMTASEAIQNGADFLVVGRPITQASDPAAAARALLEEIQRVRMVG